MPVAGRERAPADRARGSLSLRAALLAVGVVIGVLVLLSAVLGAMLKVEAPPSIAPARAAGPRLSKHLLFVVIDGLRYDYATDPARAPHFARRMAESSHGQVLAGRVTMTSAAVLTFGTGVRGDFAQLIANLNMGRAKAADLKTAARAAGLSTALVGDEVWVQAFGSFDKQTTDEHGLSMETDNAREILAAAKDTALAEPRPDWQVVHVIAPDHQGHSFGTASQRYLDYLLGFDEKLEQWLRVIPPDTTVIVVSDHGASDTGAHGADTPRERRTPLMAWGPGIKPGVELSGAEQVDLAPTMAALLGLPAPEHGRGATLVELLDVPDEQKARLACADVDRVKALAASTMGGKQAAERFSAPSCSSPGAPPEARVAEARAEVRAFDLAVDERKQQEGQQSAAAVIGALVVVLLLGAQLVVPLRLERRARTAALRFALLVLGMAALCVFLTYQVERITPPYHNVARALLFAAGNAALLYAGLRPASGARLVGRAPAFAFALLPCALAFSYTANTQAESTAVVLVVGAVWLLAPHADVLGTERLLGNPRLLPGYRYAALALGFLALLPAGIKQDDPALLVDSPNAQLAACFACLAVWLAAGASARDRERPPRSAELGAAIAVACGSLFLRRFVPYPVGVGAMLLCPALALFAARRGRNTLAAALGFASYAWVSRDFEVTSLVGAAIVLETVADAASSQKLEHEPGSLSRPWALATLTALLFAVIYIARVGLQRGLDFSNIDWGAGAFRDPSPSQWRVGASILWKYVSACLLLLWVGVRPLSRSLRAGVLLCFAIVAFGRASTLSWMLFACRNSFWTCYRGLGDAPTAMLVAASSSIALLSMAWSRRSR